MKKLFKTLLLLFLFVSALLNAQVKPDSLQAKKNKWSIGIVGGETFTCSYIKDYYANSNPWTYDERRNVDLGISFARMFNKNAISIGTSYTELGYRASNKYISTRIITYFFRELTFPLLYEREIGKRKLIKFVAGGGVMVSRFFFSSETFNSTEIYKASKYFMFSGILNAGIKIIPFENKIPFILRGEYVKNIIGNNYTFYHYTYKPDYFAISLGVFYDF